MKHNESFHGIHTRLENKGKNTLRMHAHTHTRTQTQVSSSSSSMHRGDLAWQLVSEPCCSSGRFEFIRLLSGAETRCRPESVCTEAGCRLSAAPKTKLPPSECLLWLFSPLFHFFIFLFLYSHQHFLCQESNKGVFTQRLKTGRLPN